jgi:hypothetical protein
MLRPGLGLIWEPVSGFEPLTCRLQEVRPSAPRALPAPIAQPGARMALSSLDFSGWTFHDPFHAASPTESAWEMISRVPTRQLSARILAAAGIAGAAAYTRAQGPELQ